MSITGHEIVIQEFTAPANQITTAAVAAPSGKKVVGGGWTRGPGVVPLDSAPQSATAWIVAVENTTDSDVYGNQVFAVCVDG